jgi:periplasmic divalent cation tolerance protein|tara:strand:- start:486 stop:797 length:312 start_codon:yes stop_codon:yes gene_type:complete
MVSVIIISTFPDKKTITDIANQLVKKKLAACVNITKISSIYAWQGKIENQSEYLGLIKTTKKNLKSLKKELQRLHPYDVPEIAEINPSSINKPYLKWLTESTV